MAELTDVAAQLTEVMNKFGQRTESLSASISKWQDRTSKATTETERATRAKLQEQKMITSAAEELKQMTKEYTMGRITQEEYQQALQESRDAIEARTDLDYEAKEAAKAALDQGAKRARAEERFAVATTVATKALEPISAVASGFMKGMQTTNPLEGASAILKGEMSGIASASKGVGQGLEAISPALSRLPFGLGAIAPTIARVLGKGLQTAGGALEKLKDVIDPVVAAVGEMSAAYKSASAIGTTFAGGMGELRDTAGQAGMKMKDMVAGLDAGSESFRNAGLSATAAAKFVGQFGKGLVQGKEATQLFALGFQDPAERIRLMSGAVDQARASGKSLAEIQSNVGQLTVQYGKDLKVLQTIAGKDAEKALEKGRLEAQRASLTAKMDTDQKDAYSKVFASLSALGPEAGKAQMALTQLAAGGEITDPDVLINKPMMEMIQKMAGIVTSGSKTAIDDAGRVMGEAAEKARLGAQTGDVMSGIDQAVVQMGKAADGGLQSMTALNNALLAYKIDPEAAAAARKNVDTLTTNTDKTTEAVDKITQSQYKLQTALEQAATSVPVVSTFGKVVEESIKPMQAMIDKLNDIAKAGGEGGVAGAAKEAAKGITAKDVGEVIGGGLVGAGGTTVGAGIGAAIGTAIFPGIGTAVGAALGGLVGGWVGGNSGAKVGGAIAESLGNMVKGSGTPAAGGAAETPSVIQGNAAGGIMSGSSQGYPVMLHGREMIIPLPDDFNPSDVKKSPLESAAMEMSSPSVPANRESSQMMEAMVDHLSRMNDTMMDMVNHMRDVANHTEATARGVA